MKKQLQKMLGLLALTVAISAPAQAGGLNYQYNLNGQWVQAYSSTASVYLTIEGNGTNRIVTLQSHSGNWSTGDEVYWFGEIPADSIKAQGVHEVSISVNTCEHDAWYSTGCGIIELTATSEPGWENFRTLTQTSNFHTWDHLILQQVGHIQDRYTSTTGSVNGYPINIDNSGDVKTWMSRMGTAVDVLVSVTGTW